ncbi:MAG: clostripain-related cysteine peptidase [Candidatus Thermoplasmatota archaeon]|jgi:hypothetical protein|nr:clostripain-related cysteine peptidase [Candidatus Thermoplasmatota archaeon]
MRGVDKGDAVRIGLVFLLVSVLITSGCIQEEKDDGDKNKGGGGQTGGADTDKDGVLDATDAFPSDPAASVDTDGDGLPNQWNPGQSQSNSTTGLTIDPYPNDPNNGAGDDDDDNNTNNNTSGDTWTFMVYMSDCDLEYFALLDFNEMESIGSGDKYNIVVQLDRWESDSERDDRSNGDWRTAKRFLVKKDANAELISSPAISDQGEINCGDPAQLVSFVKWAMTTYPAEHYFLDLWDHGDGIEGVCWDQSTPGNDQLTIKELGSALSQITNNGAKKLDIIGFDACLMSTIEVAYEMAPYSKYMIASEITEPGSGWDYSFLSALATDPTIGAVPLGKKIVDTFVAQRTENPAQSHTLSLLDQSKVGGVKSNLDQFTAAVKNASGTELSVMKQARESAQPIKKGSSSNMVDIYDYLTKAKTLSGNGNVQTGAQKVIDSLGGFVLHFLKFSGTNDLNVDNAHGLSIYAPEFGLAQQDEYADTSFEDDSSWDELLDDYYSEFQVDQVIYFVPATLMYMTTDGDLDGDQDSLWVQFEINSREDYVYGYLSIDVYDALGYLIDYLEYNFVISTYETISVELGELGFALEETDGEPGYYQMVIYMCLGDQFDIDYIQDYAETDLVWLEYYEGGGGGG